MGTKNSKNIHEPEIEPHSITIPPKNPELNDDDYAFLMPQTGMNREEIKDIFDKFQQNNLDLKLDKKEFLTLYTQLRYESPESLDEISEHIFRAFDHDHNGTINFNEFMVNEKKIKHSKSVFIK